MRIAGLIGSFAVAGALAACAHHETTGATAPQGYSPISALSGGAGSCPLARLEGVHATLSEMRNGVAITFTAPESELDRLRENVHAMADANDKQGNAFAECPCGAAAPAIGAAEMQRVKADASVEETPGGVILKLTAKHPGDVHMLRSNIRSDVDALNYTCLSNPAPPDTNR
jgi:hypothetical protein